MISVEFTVACGSRNGNSPPDNHLRQFANHQPLQYYNEVHLLIN